MNWLSNVFNTFEVIIKLFYSLFNDASNINSYVIKHPSIVFLFLLQGFF